jgi:hypothetical protein
VGEEDNRKKKERMRMKRKYKNRRRRRGVAWNSGSSLRSCPRDDKSRR